MKHNVVILNPVHMAGGLELDDLLAPLQPKHSVIL